MERNKAMQAIEKVLMEGDLSNLTPELRLKYYKDTCESLQLNALTKPFEYIRLNGKLTLYATKSCTEQLRQVHGISITRLETKSHDGLYMVIASATDKEGRTDVATGAVNVDGLRGEQLANAFMKAETKAKRRVTLSLSGLGWIDESQIETIDDAKIIKVNDDGVIVAEVEHQKTALINDQSLGVYKSKLLQATSQEEFKKIFGEGYMALGAYPEDRDKLKAFYDEEKGKFNKKEEAIN